MQNLLIAALSVSAVLLLAELGLPAQETGGGYLSGLFSAGTASGDRTQDQQPDLAAPVRVAVTGNYGRYGDLTLTTADDAFSSLGRLLGEALGSAGDSTECSAAEFRQSLENTSLYYDFGTALPLSVLENFLGADGGEDEQTAQRMVLAASGDTVALYLSDGTVYRRCETRIPPESLTQLVSRYQLGNASFAFDLEDQPGLMPYSLFLTGDQASYPVLSASNALTDQDALLQNFGFNPHINSRYTESSGAEVVREEERTLRIQTDGTVLFQDGGNTPAFQISAQGEIPTAKEAVKGAYRLLSAQLTAVEGDAALCLRSASLTGQVWTVQFDRQVGGVLLRRSDGQPAAQVVLNGKSVASCSLSFRQYRTTAQDSLLLPLTQALAIAKSHRGAQLEIVYQDGGSDSVSAVWLAD